MVNKKEVPAEVKSCTQRELFSSEVFWDEINPKTRLQSFVSTTKSSGKNVLRLNFIKSFIGKTMDGKHEKPTILKLYDFSKDGTDIVDQKTSYYSFNTKTARWPVIVFTNMLNTARVSAQSTFSHNNNRNKKFNLIKIYVRNSFGSG